MCSITAISCRSVVSRTRGGSEEETAGLSADEQDKRALVLFQQIFDVMESSDRKEAVPKMETLYREIVDKYPKAVLSQEAYWRLVLIYLNDYDPPEFDKAEAAYEDFIARYPGSQFRREIENDLSNACYRGGNWERLMKFYAPAVRQYRENGRIERPLDMFMYAEVKNHLGDTAEAVKGYKVVITRFPASRESVMAKQRLEAIEKEKANISQ